MSSFPNNERIIEISKKLTDQQGRISRLMVEHGLFEKMPLIILQCEDWSDFKKYRYQPRAIAHLIANAEWHRDRISEAQQELNKAKQRKKNEGKKIKREISKIECVTKSKFDELPPNIRMNSFYKSNKEINGNPNIRKYAAENIKISQTKNRLERLSKRSAGSPDGKDATIQTKPFEKPFYIFCRDMKNLFIGKGLKPNYELIARLSNLFRLSKKPQTPATVRKRFSRDKI